VPIPAYTMSQSLHISPYNTNNISHLCTNLLTTNKKMSHLFIEPEAIWQVEFDYAIAVLKGSLKDYDIARAKLVFSLTHYINIE
jgi:hypothetical protein